jgi:hypothetical protein
MPTSSVEISALISVRRLSARASLELEAGSHLGLRASAEGEQLNFDVVRSMSSLLFRLFPIRFPGFVEFEPFLHVLLARFLRCKCDGFLL